VLGLTVRRTLAIVGATALAGIAVPLAISTTAGAAPSGDGVNITQADNTSGCNGVRTTPGSENTTKILVGGTLVPGGTAIFQISFPFDPAKLTGQDTFTMTDCIFIGDTAIAKYFIDGVPNGTSPFVFQITVDIPADADLGGLFCNYVRTESNPTAPQESNRKAGPACFRIGGDLRIVKVAEGDESQTPLAGASFDVSCDPPGDGESVPPVVISGLSGSTTFVDPAYVASGVAASGVIAIAGPIGTECTVTETAPPAGYDLPAEPTQTLTIGDTQVTGTFVDPLTITPNDTAIVTDATSGTVGDSISDTATLSGATEGATGTITFDLFDTSDCSGDPVFTSTVDVNGNGDYVSDSFTPDAAGSYYWIASYSGDEANNPSTGSCGDDGETSVLKAKPTPSHSSSPESTSTTTPPPSHSSSPIAVTGAGPVNDELNWALGLLLLGGAIVLAGKQRGYRRLH
jgi:hypothetical protein